MNFCKCVFETGRGVLIPGLVMVLALSGCEGHSGEASAARIRDHRTDAPVRVLLGRLERGTVSDRLSVDADLEPVAKADCHPQIPGVVRKVLKREGDPVKYGEPVILLAADELELQVENKRILHAQARIRVQQAEVAQREGTELSRQKKILLEKAQNVFSRAKTLAAGASPGIISSEELEAKSYDLEDARITYETASLRQEKYKLDYAQRVEEEKLQAVDLKTAEYYLSQTVLASPLDGVISYLRLKPGERAQTTARAFSVVDLTKLEARLQVPQRELARIREGLKVVLECEVFPDKEFHGTVEVINPVVGEQGTVEVLVAVVDPTGFLKPGMFVNGEIILETRDAALLVPKKAVSYDNQEPVIFLVRDQIAHRYVVIPGFATRDAIEVVALTGMDGTGINLGVGDLEGLVLVGHDNLTEGSRIESEDSVPNPES